MYAPLAPRKPDFDLVRDLMIETGVLDQKIEFEEYVDTRFAEHARARDGVELRARRRRALSSSAGGAGQVDRAQAAA